MLLEIIYKKTRLGQTQIWRQEISEDGSSYRSISGKLDGKQVIGSWTLCTPKNVGKNNETTPQQQCLLEVESNYREKLAQGNYKKDLDAEALDEDNYFLPMLADKYRVDYLPTLEDYAQDKIYSQPKLDGVRCIMDPSGMWTRKGKPLVSAPHIFDAFKDDKNQGIRVDGELYSNRLSDNFNEIISIARKTKLKPEDIEKSKEFLQLWVYDMPSHKGNFKERFEALCTWHETLSEEQQRYIRIVPTNLIKSEEQLDGIYSVYMEDGYEGQMVRISQNEYENFRAQQLLKRKEFIDEEFEIVDILDGRGNRSGIAAKVLSKMPGTDEPFEAGIKGNFAFYAELYAIKDELKRTLVTIKYQKLSPDRGVPIFGVATKFHRTTTREL